MSGNQRWEGGRDRYRPPTERITPSEYEVAALPDDTTAKRFVIHHHYSRTYGGSRRIRFAMYRGAELVGVALFGCGGQPRAALSVFPALDPAQATELLRFVLTNEVPGNGETWFLARCFDLLRRHGILGVVSYSDPWPRTNAGGRTIFGGHLGTIYQAHNAVYLGMTKGHDLALLPDGTSFNPRTARKVVTGEKGVGYAARQLIAHGAEDLAPRSSPRSRERWLDQWLPRLTRPFYHGGNHKYAWPLDRRTELRGQAHPYPKRVA